MASALVFELSKVETVRIREAMVGHLRHIDEDLARRVADGLALTAMPPAPPAARPVQEQPPSPPLSVIANMKATLEGRSVGILFDEGSDAAAIAALRGAAERAGAAVKLVSPRVGGAVLSDGKRQAADGQLAGTPSVLFDAVAIVLAPEAARMLCNEESAAAFAKHAYIHLKAIAVDAGGRTLLEHVRVQPDEAIVDCADVDSFVHHAAMRMWKREPLVRKLH